MRRTLGSAVVAPGLLAAAVLLAGCQGVAGAVGSSPAAPAAPAPASTAGPAVRGGAQLTAQVIQYRRDAQRDVIQVKVTNLGEEPVRVARIALESSTFVETAYENKDSRIGAGLSVDLSVPLVDPACDPRESRDVGTGVVGDGGTEGGTDGGRHRVGLQVDGNGIWLAVDDTVLQQVRTRRCAERAVSEVVSISFERTWTDAGEVDGEPALRGRLALTPAPGAGPVHVAMWEATTLFRVTEPVAADLGGEGPGSRPELLDVVVTVMRCDPHAVAEDKKGYLFPVRVQEPGAAEIRVEVAVPVLQRAPLQDLIDRTCR